MAGSIPEEASAVIETYIALVAYIVLHQIYVIPSDFVEAFGIPSLNIGIYIDKLASIRALLMAIAYILEWAITKKGFNDAGDSKTLTDPSERRIASVMSFIAMLICRIMYLWLIYKSDNKSLNVFITLSVEGFWFGFFTAGFFAIGPKYTAFTSFALHLSGNLAFFFQKILDSLSNYNPGMDSLYRVRVNAWITLTTTLVALAFWIWFLREELSELEALVRSIVSEVDPAEEGSSSGEDIAEKLEDVLDKVKKQLEALIKFEFGITFYEGNIDKVDVKKAKSVTINFGGYGNHNAEASVKITKDSEKSGQATSVYVKNSSIKFEGSTVVHNVAKKLADAFVHQKVKAKITQSYVAAGGSASFHEVVGKLTGSLEGELRDARDVASALATAMQNANNPVELEDSRSFKALVDEPYWFETASFNDLVNGLKTRLEGHSYSQASSVAEKISEALADGSMCLKIKAVVQHDFGLSGVTVKKEESKNTVTVDIGTSDRRTTREGSASITVKGSSGSQNNVTITVQGISSIIDTAKGTSIAKRLAKAAELAKNLAEAKALSLKEFTVKSDETAEEVRGYLMTKLSDSGSPKFKALVDALKTRFGSAELTAEQLYTALNAVRQQITELLNDEFGIPDAEVNKVEAGTSTNKVTVTIGSGTIIGTSVVKSGLEIEVKLLDSLPGLSGNADEKKAKAIQIAQRLAKAARNALKKVENANLVEALVHAEFGLDQTVNVAKEPSENKVTVTIGSGSGASGTAKVQVGGERFQALVEALNQQVSQHLKGSLSDAKQIAGALGNALENSTQKIRDLVQAEFGITITGTGIIVSPGRSKVIFHIGTSDRTTREATVDVKKTGGPQVTVTVEFKVKVDSDAGKNEKVAKMLAQALGDSRVKEAVLKKGYEIALSGMSDPRTITIEVKGDTSVKSNKANNIAKRVAKAVELARERVNVKPVQQLVRTDFELSSATVEVTEGGTNGHKKVTVTIDGQGTESSGRGAATLLVLKGDKTVPLTINVTGSTMAQDIALRLADALADPRVKDAVNRKAPGTDIRLQGGGLRNAWSPLLLFPVGSFMKDFMYPGILPFAFLDTQKANLINYTMPIFYMSGAFFVLLVNDVFAKTGIVAAGLESHFKAWSNGTASGWIYHFFWLLHVPMILVYLISLFAVHSIYPSLRGIIHSRCRVMLMTFALLIPRSHLEVMGYVGVANYAILGGDYGWDLIC